MCPSAILPSLVIKLVDCIIGRGEKGDLPIQIGHVQTLRLGQELGELEMKMDTLRCLIQVMGVIIVMASKK